MDFMTDLENQPAVLDIKKPFKASNKYPSDQLEQKISQSAKQSTNLQNTQQPLKQKENLQKNQASGATRFFKLIYYEKYFKSTESQILNRIKIVLLPPWDGEFFQSIRPVADFYGPIWLMTFIVFLLGLCPNITNYILSYFTVPKLSYFFDLSLPQLAFIVVYSYAIIIPTLFFFILKFLGLQLFTLAEFLCFYAYSCSSIIPTCLLCLIPISFLHWIFLALGFAASATFIIKELRRHFTTLVPVQLILLVTFLVIHCSFFVVIKLVFFSLFEQLKL